jgi:hypothetical protein
VVTLYHRTTEDIARLIVVDGFRDGEGYYGTEYLHSGVVIVGPALLLVEEDAHAGNDFYKLSGLGSGPTIVRHSIKSW